MEEGFRRNLPQGRKKILSGLEIFFPWHYSTTPPKSHYPLKKNKNVFTRKFTRREPQRFVHTILIENHVTNELDFYQLIKDFSQLKEKKATA